jgi:hypothetical protein
MKTRNRLPFGAFFVLLIVALALLGVGYSMWAETLIIQGTVQTGEVDVAFEDATVEECVDVNGVLTCPEPDFKAYAANCTLSAEETSDDSPGDDGQDLLTVAVSGMYPSWHCKLNFKVANLGNVPVHVKLPKLVAGKEYASWVKLDTLNCYQDGVQLHQGANVSQACTIDIHFTNETSPGENAGPFVFTWEILAHQWNEEPISVNPGAPTYTKAAGARFKGWNTGAELFLGPMLPPSALPRQEGNYNEFQTVGQKTYQITFAFDKVENTLSSSIASPGASVSFDFDTQGTPGCPAASWDVMQIYLKDSRTDSAVALENVKLGLVNLGDFGSVDKAGVPGDQNWTVTGFDFSESFQVTADMLVDGFLGNEGMKVEFNVGCLP